MLTDKQLTRALSVFPPQQREQARSLLLSIRGRGSIPEAEALQMACSCILVGSRAVGKRLSDRRTDKNRRTLIGARVPRDLADQCKAEAERRGMSVYRWVVWALERGLEG